ncbi:unnamed protein product [Periconia digitata]|uniref:Uncharacterized protein n=1 Tax=Periconia digitata TaxID=1303443 RepID=A0A9W4XMC5_9PLEO|nr:unnamed protein product [Periconia digitata]
MLIIDLIWIARTADLAPKAPQIFEWEYVKDDIRFVLETQGLGSFSSEVLRVYCRSQILYDIPLQNLIDQGKRLWISLRNSGAEVRAEQLPASAKAKYPSIALRYELPVEGKIRRLQFKFASPSDYDQVLNHLLELGLQIEQVPSKDPPRTERVSCPPSKLTEISKRPSTTASLSRLPHPSPLLESRPISAQSVAPIVRPSSPPKTSFAASSISVDGNAFTSSSTSHHDTFVSRPDSPAILLNQVNGLPPRRELPFQRPESAPKSHGSDNSRPSSRASTATMAPPPIPRSQTTFATALPPLPKPTILSSSPSLSRHIMGEPTRTSSTKFPDNKRADDRTKTKRPRTGPSTMTEQDGLLFTGSDNIRPPSSGSSVIFNRPPSATSGRQRSIDPPNRLSTPLSSDHAEQYYHKPRDSSDNSTNHATSLATYASQPDEDRKTNLNCVLLQYLEDPSFLTLLEDVETAWARIAPGHG